MQMLIEHTHNSQYIFISRVILQQLADIQETILPLPKHLRFSIPKGDFVVKNATQPQAKHIGVTHSGSLDPCSGFPQRSRNHSGSDWDKTIVSCGLTLSCFHAHYLKMFVSAYYFIVYIIQ